MVVGTTLHRWRWRVQRGPWPVGVKARRMAATSPSNHRGRERAARRDLRRQARAARSEQLAARRFVRDGLRAALKRLRPPDLRESSRGGLAGLTPHQARSRDACDVGLGGGLAADKTASNGRIVAGDSRHARVAC